MAHFALIRANLAAWGIATVVDPAEFWALDEGNFKSINGDDGGSWDPAAFISVGGAGLELRGANHSLANAGVLTVANGGDIVVANGGDVIIQAGGSIDVTGDVNIDAAGDLNVNATGTLNVENNGVAEFKNGSDVQFQNGCVVTHSNATTFDATSFCYWAAASHFTIQAGCLTSVAADFNISSANLLVTSGAVKMGVGGSIVHKIVPIATDASYAIDLTAGDSFKHTSGGLTGDQIWYLPVAAETGQRIAIRNLHVTHSILLYDGMAPYSEITSLRNFPGQIGSCELEWNSTDWEVISTYTVL